MNPFTDEERTSRMKLAIDGFCDQLRAPETLHRVTMEYKPATMSTGDFALKAMFDSVLMALIVRGDYRGAQRLLVSVFGEEVTNVTPQGHSVNRGDARQFRAAK